MSRLNIETVVAEAKESFVPESDFDKLIESYFMNKQEEKSYKSICAEQNESIKDYLHKKKSNHEEVGPYTVNLAVKDKTKFNEDRLLAFMKEHNLTSCIRTKEYVDMNIVETLIYDGQISTELLAEMDSCKDPKFEEALTVSKKKKKKEE